MKMKSALGALLWLALASTVVGSPPVAVSPTEDTVFFPVSIKMSGLTVEQARRTDVQAVLVKALSDTLLCCPSTGYRVLVVEPAAVGVSASVFGGIDERFEKARHLLTALAAVEQADASSMSTVGYTVQFESVEFPSNTKDFSTPEAAYNSVSTDLRLNLEGAAFAGNWKKAAAASACTGLPAANAGSCTFLAQATPVPGSSEVGFSYLPIITAHPTPAPTPPPTIDDSNGIGYAVGFASLCLVLGSCMCYFTYFFEGDLQKSFQRFISGEALGDDGDMGDGDIVHAPYHGDEEHELELQPVDFAALSDPELRFGRGHTIARHMSTRRENMQLDYSAAPDEIRDRPAALKRRYSMQLGANSAATSVGVKQKVNLDSPLFGTGAVDAPVTLSMLFAVVDNDSDDGDPASDGAGEGMGMGAGEFTVAGRTTRASTIEEGVEEEGEESGDEGCANSATHTPFSPPSFASDQGQRQLSVTEFAGTVTNPSARHKAVAARINASTAVDAVQDSTNDETEIAPDSRLSSEQLSEERSSLGSPSRRKPRPPSAITSAVGAADGVAAFKPLGGLSSPAAAVAASRRRPSLATGMLPALPKPPPAALRVPVGKSLLKATTSAAMATQIMQVPPRPRGTVPPRAMARIATSTVGAGVSLEDVTASAQKIRRESVAAIAAAKGLPPPRPVGAAPAGSSKVRRMSVAPAAPMTSAAGRVDSLQRQPSRRMSALEVPVRPGVAAPHTPARPANNAATAVTAGGPVSALGTFEEEEQEDESNEICA